METLNKKKDGYSSRFGLLMVMVGGSVGTGNLWRFPRLVCTYGGAFVIAAVVSLLIIAIPLVMVENFAGRASRHLEPFVTCLVQNGRLWEPLRHCAIL